MNLNFTTVPSSMDKFSSSVNQVANRSVALSDAVLNREVRISGLTGPACERLRDMGFCEQMQLRKISNGRNLICTVCGAKMAISRELARHVMVEAIR